MNPQRAVPAARHHRVDRAGCGFASHQREAWLGAHREHRRLPWTAGKKVGLGWSKMHIKAGLRCT